MRAPVARGDLVPPGEDGRRCGRSGVVLAGDYNVIPEDRQVYKPERWTDDALFQPEPRALYRKLGAGLDRLDPPTPS